jgi:hypothetical protein
MGRGIGNRQKKIVAPKKVWVKPSKTAKASPRAGVREGSPLALFQRRPRPKVASREASGRQDGVRGKQPPKRKV